MNDPVDYQVGVEADIVLHYVKIFVILSYCQYYFN